MLKNKVITYAFEGLVGFLGEFDDQVSGMHADSLVTLTRIGDFVTREHPRLHMNVFLHDNHFLPNSILHDR